MSPRPGLELPRINYDCNGKRHRFVYGNRVEESALSKQVTFLNPAVLLRSSVGTSDFKSPKSDLLTNGPRQLQNKCRNYCFIFLLQKKEVCYRSENCLLTQRQIKKINKWFFEVQIFFLTVIPSIPSSWNNWA